jgi:endo-alpha-1,4-polygalactosaminidase (GH114 family)
VFGKSKEEKAQDAQLKQLQKGINDCWAWIQYHEKNMAILIKNNSAFIKKNKTQANLNLQLTKSVNALIEKDKQHDKKDAEHDALIQNLKNLGKALETVTTTTEG